MTDATSPAHSERPTEPRVAEVQVIALSKAFAARHRELLNRLGKE
ncbi:hypothetical protein [Nocardia sp. NPDC058705]